MEDVALLLVRGLIAGLFVTLFSLVSEMAGPKSFSGMFGAAPSIALASLLVTVADRGVRPGQMQSFSMIFGAVAMVAYCLSAVVGIDRWGARRGSLAAFASWFAVAAAGYGAVLLVVS